jgi:enoyl-CoA hydratase/carnithine racemase
MVGDLRTIDYRTADGLAVVSLARPDKRNAMNVQMFEELGDAAEQAASDPDVRGIIVRAEGPSFCAGIDLGALAGFAVDGATEEGFGRFVAIAQRPYRLLATIPKPVIAAVQGHALGAGFQLALACDVRIASTDATFALLEARYGLIPDLGGLHHLVRQIGPARAKELAWSARAIDAAEAERLGLVNRVVDGGSLDVQARAFAFELLAHSPVTAGHVKSLVARATETELEVELQREAEAQAASIRSQDHREAVAAFLEKRTPRFVGK